MKTIGYFTPFNPYTDRKAWSGTIFKIRESIENAGYRILWIPYYSPIKIFSCITKILNLFFKKKFLPDHNILYYYISAKTIKKNLLKQCDYYFFPTGGEIMPYLPIKKDAIYFSDATFHIMVNYYWYNLTKFSLKQGELCEKKAIQACCINLRASQWAVNSVINDYQGKPENTYVIELGANLDDKDIHLITPYSGGKLNILFSGVEWERKGADIAIKTVVMLNEMGIDAHLYLVGIRQEFIPENYQNIPNINYIGYLNKNNPREYSTYIDIVSKSHILLLPTKAECAGIVFCEASGFGLPIFTYDTGGIGNYCINGINGYRLPITANEKDFAAAIFNVIQNNEMIKLHKGALNLYKTRINWNSWSKSFELIMKDKESITK